MPDGLNDFGQGVLKAYLARQELDQRATQLAQEHEQAQNLLKFHYKELDNTAKQHKETIDLQKAIFKQKMGQHYNELMGNVQSAPESAQYQTADTQVYPNQPQGIIDQSPGTQGGVDVGGGNLGLLPGIQHQILTKANPWQYNPPEAEGLGISPVTIDPQYQQKMRDLGQVQADIEGAKKGAETKAEWDVRAPIEFQKQSNLLENQRAIQGEKTQSAWDIANARITSAEEQGGLNRSSRERIASMNNAVKREAIKAKLNDAQTNDLYGGFVAAADGQRRLGSNKNDAAISSALARAGWINQDPKVASAANDQITLENHLNNAQEFVNAKTGNDLADAAATLPHGIGQNLNPNLKQKWDTFQMGSLGATKAISGYTNRLNLPELQLSRQGFPTAADSRDAGQTKINSGWTQLWNNQWDKALAGMPDDQKLWKLERQSGGMDGLITRYSGKQIENPHYAEGSGQPKFIPIVGKSKSTGGYKLWNPNKKKYIDLTDTKEPVQQAPQRPAMSVATGNNEEEEE